MLRDIKDAADRGMPILAECAGFMYLMESLEDPDGNEYKMAGVLPGSSHMTQKLTHFGYVKGTRNADNMYLGDGEEILGHEFHYYKADDDGNLLMLTKPSGKRSWPGYMSYNKVFAGFAHLYYPSCPAFVRRFLNA
jgi:cobyrinic acid a,c-diamide synthase